MRRFAKNIEVLDLAASVAFDAGDYETAISHLETIYKAAPQRLGTLGRLSAAVNRFRGAAENDSDKMKRYRTLVDGLVARAETDDIPARFVTAVSMYYDARFDDAITALDALRQAAKHEARIYIYLAMSHHWLGHADKAKELSKIAIEVDPNDPDVYYCRSKIMRTDDPLLAIADLQRYLERIQAPGVLAFADKITRVKADLAALDRGETPPDWDRPTIPSAWLSPGGRPRLDRIVPLIICVLMIFGIIYLRRRRKTPKKSS